MQPESQLELPSDRIIPEPVLSTPTAPTLGNGLGSLEPSPQSPASDWLKTDAARQARHAGACIGVYTRDGAEWGVVCSALTACSGADRRHEEGLDPTNWA